MYKLFFVLLTLIFLQGCGQTASLLGTGATIAAGGSSTKTLLSTSTNLYIEKKTGKNTFQHVSENTVEAELRECEVNHSAEINEIFFKTLDQIDCVIR